MKKLLLLILIFITVSGCESFSNPSEKKSDKTKQWVFISVESPMRADTASYFYYGQINRQVLIDMNQGKLGGYFEIKNLRFINQENQLEIYEDTALVGSKYFRIKDITRVELLKKDPISFYEKNEIAENTKDVLGKTNK